MELTLEQKRVRNRNYQIKYNANNLDRVREFKRRWQRDNRLKIAEWANNNIERVRVYKKRYKQTNKNAQIAGVLRMRICSALRSQNARKTNKTSEYIGCSFQELRSYLEKQFKNGMTWKNRGLFGWHIDHIKPVKEFDLTKIEEQKKCFHFSNLQPLWAEENLKKRFFYVKQT